MNVKMWDCEDLFRYIGMYFCQTYQDTKAALMAQHQTSDFKSQTVTVNNQ